MASSPSQARKRRFIFGQASNDANKSRLTRLYTRVFGGRDDESERRTTARPKTTLSQAKSKATVNPAFWPGPYAAADNDGNHDESPTASPSARKKCLTCLDVLPLSLFPEAPISPECEHPAGQMCMPCLGQSLQAQLDELDDRGFICPLCKKSMSEKNVQLWAAPEVLHRYNILRTRRTLASDPNFIWCSNPRCDDGQTRASGAKTPIMICTHCGTRTCFTHQRPWHEGMTCEEFDNPELVIEQQSQRGRKKATAGADPKRKVYQTRARTLEAAKPREVRPRKAKEKSQKKRVAQKEAEEQKRKEKEEKRRQLEERWSRLREERLGEAEVRRTTKKCPGINCAYRIYKTGGCSHMTCESGIWLSLFSG
ncbi:hypothetical protein BJX99DRAFT_232452 [Aspergillus californicus]